MKKAFKKNINCVWAVGNSTVSFIEITNVYTSEKAMIFTSNNIYLTIKKIGRHWSETDSFRNKLGFFSSNINDLFTVAIKK